MHNRFLWFVSYTWLKERENCRTIRHNNRTPNIINSPRTAKPQPLLLLLPPAAIRYYREIWNCVWVYLFPSPENPRGALRRYVYYYYSPGPFFQSTTCQANETSHIRLHFLSVRPEKFWNEISVVFSSSTENNRKPFFSSFYSLRATKTASSRMNSRWFVDTQSKKVTSTPLEFIQSDFHILNSV